MPQTSTAAHIAARALLGALLTAAACAATPPPDSGPTAPEAAAAPAASTPAPLDPFAAGKVEAGATKAGVCAACHGPNGNSTNPEWPRLAGQSAVYIAEQLHLFKSGARPNPVMMPMASNLSEQDISDLAVYFEAQTPVGLEADPSYWQAGQALYVRGDAGHAVPACVACHGPVGRGNLAAGYPALRAQQSVYVVKQLTDYASGARYTGNNPAQASRNGTMMFTIAKRLSPEQIRDVASYVQGMR